MLVRFWGTRGSIPAPGPHSVRYGGNTACVTVNLDHGPLIILDAGTGIRNLGRHLSQTSGHCQAFLLLSHGHWDHIQGFPFFAPLNDEHCRIRVMGGPTGTRQLEEILTNQQRETYFPVALENAGAEVTFEDLRPGGVSAGRGHVTDFPTRHPGGGRGFRIEEAGEVVVYLTDNELPESGYEWDFYVNACQGASVLIHDAQYWDSELPDKAGWGHSSCEQATRLALDAGVSQLVLFHHDPDRTDDDVDSMVRACRRLTAQRDPSLIVQAATEGAALEVKRRERAPAVRPERPRAPAGISAIRVPRLSR